MRILLLGKHRPEIINFIRQFNDEIIWSENKITIDSELLSHVDFLISYGYRHILKDDVLEKFEMKAINIHISLLPWNRGADPNLWSFLEDSPKGVSIHYLERGIDTGKLLVQREVNFSHRETLRTSYFKLSKVAQNLFKRHWPDIREGKIVATQQPTGGSYHLLKDKAVYKHLLTQGWDTPVGKLIGKALHNKE